MIAGYQEAADYAAPKGISVGLQNHPSTGDDMLRIRRETDRENFNFIMDTGMWIGALGSYPRDDDPKDVDFYAFMEQVMPHALYVRTKFCQIENGVDEWLDYDRILPILKGANLQRLYLDRIRRASGRPDRAGSPGGCLPARNLAGY